eukprot:3863219-Rhodomonas_salina.1
MMSLSAGYQRLSPTGRALSGAGGRRTARSLCVCAGLSVCGSGSVSQCVRLIGSAEQASVRYSGY